MYIQIQSNSVLLVCETHKKLFESTVKSKNSTSDGN